jgi:hypothetical protein
MALATVSAIASWNKDVRMDWIDVDSIAPDVRANQLLSETAPYAAHLTGPA